MRRCPAVLVPFVLCAAAALPAQAVEWFQKDLDAAIAAAKDKPAGMVMLYLWRENDGKCGAMFGGTLSHADAAATLRDFVCLGIKEDEAGRATFERFGVQQVPTVLFVDAQGTVVDVLQGRIAVAPFVAECKRVREGADTIPKLVAKANGAEDDLPLQLRLAHKLRAAGDKAGAAKLVAHIVGKDPKSNSEAGAEAMLWKLSDEIFKPGALPADYDLKPLKEFLGKQKHKRVQFLGHDRVAAAEYRRLNWKAAGEAAKLAWKNVPADQVLDYGQALVSKAYANWKVIEKADKSLLKAALDVSKKALDEAEKIQKAKPDAPFWADALYLHAAILLVNDQRKDAFALMDKAIATDPNNENLKKVRARWLDGDK